MHIKVFGFSEVYHEENETVCMNRNSYLIIINIYDCKGSVKKYIFFNIWIPYNWVYVFEWK